MTFDELVSKIIEILPTCEFGEDLDGQMVIYTNLRNTKDGEELEDMGTAA